MKLQAGIELLNRTIRKQGLRPFARRTGISPSSAHNAATRDRPGMWNVYHLDWTLSQIGFELAVVPLPKRPKKGQKEAVP